MRRELRPSLQDRAPAPPGTAPGSAGPAGAPLGGGRAEALRRLQAGAIGVFAVLLLVGLASIIKDRAMQSDTTTVAGAAPTTAPAPADAAGDPLVEAGVVPEIPDTTPDAAASQTNPAPAASATGADAR